MKLQIPRGLYERMVADCLAGLPNEACGFLGGRQGVVEEIYPLENVAASPVFYRPNDKQMLHAMNDLDSKGLELSAIYHSHVASPAIPSPTDIREAHYPDSVYLIVSLVDRSNPSARGYLIHKKDWRDDVGDLSEVELVLS